jgi:hypothetical protein
MPYTEAQKRANKKWRDTNRDHYLEGVKKWKNAQPGYAVKNYEYVKKYRTRRQLIKEEFMILCSIEV